MTDREKFIEIYTSKITREGAGRLLEFLKNSDFFTAPASTKYHLAEESGLLKHSLNVYARLEKLVLAEYGETKISAETVAVCGLLHDLCKVNFYKVDYRNVKTEAGWELKPYYAVDDRLPYGHGEKSVYIISGYMRLSREEAMAINWHMGGFDDRVRIGSYTIAGAYRSYPLAVLLHAADLMASYLDEEGAE
jgi:HD domain.